MAYNDTPPHRIQPQMSGVLQYRKSGMPTPLTHHIIPPLTQN